MTAAGSVTGPLAHAVAARPATGERQSGDRAVVAGGSGGVLVGVIDGLGHGPAAAVAADAAADVLTSHADDHLVELVRRCHEHLRPTRGAAVSLARLRREGTLEWLAVGNVQGAVIRAATGETGRLVTRGGVVGLRLPTLRPATAHIDPGDRLGIFTDGVDEDVTRDLALPGNPQTVADKLLDRYAVRADDALLLLAEYLGASR